jgi:egghead protein (zeste-white 4 protein)
MSTSRGALISAGYYLAVFVPVVLYLLLAHLRWYGAEESEAEFSIQVLLVAQAAWIVPYGFAMINMLGLVWFGPPADRRPGAGWKWDPDFTLIVAYVSRGQNQETLERAARQTQDVLDSLGVRYVIETVSDVEIAPRWRLAKTSGALHYAVVPADYQTPRGTRFKARALQYLLEDRTKRLGGNEDAENIWVLHLDEESFVTPEAILGIQEFVARYDLRHTPGAIGQGEILYNSGRYGRSAVIEAIDSIRSGEDLGRFRVQFGAWHRPVFGMHGSYILTPARTERLVTWDVGGYGAITEDAYFALLACERGVRFDWVAGFIREQSPFSLRDLVEQRRRWFCGLAHIARDPSLKFSTTAVLRLAVFFWQFSWIGCVVSLMVYARSFMPQTTNVPQWAVTLVAVCGGLFCSTYVVGAYRNVLRAQLSPARKGFNVAFTFCAWLALIPVMVESFAIVYALVRPVRHFHVVAKDLPAAS